MMTFVHKRRGFICIFLLILLCWTPYILMFGSRIVSWDGAAQLIQVLKRSAPENNHPYSSTFLMGGILKITSLFTNNINHQLLLFGLAQTFCFVLVISLLLSWIKQHFSNSVFLLSLTFYALFPLFPIYSITFDKSGYFLLGILMLSWGGFKICTDYQQCHKFQIATYILIISGSLLTILFRDDGIYITLTFLAFALLKKELRKFFATVLLGVIVLWLIITKVWYPNVPVQHSSGDGGAMSLPTQQVARVVAKNGNISKKLESELNQYLPMNQIGKLYDENLADPVKFKYRQLPSPKYKNDARKTYTQYSKFLKERSTFKFLKLWTKLGLSNIKTYIAAFVYQVDGYFSPWAKINNYSYEGQLFFGISSHKLTTGWNTHLKPMIPEVQYFGNTNSTLAKKARDTVFGLNKVFIFKHLIFAAYLYVWILLFCLINFFYNSFKRKHFSITNFLPIFLDCCVLGIALLSPVDGAIRYIMPIIFTLPLLFLSTHSSAYFKRK